MRVLFLAIIGLGSLTKTVSSYPEEVSDDILRHGCAPFQKGICPAKMFCWVDLKYERFGQCGCRGGYVLKMAPPTPTEPGSEIAYPPRRTDCVMVGFLNLPSGLSFLGCCITYLVVFFTTMSMLRSVIKNGGFKPNSSCVALVTLNLCSFFSFWKIFTYVLNRWDMDPYWHWYGTLYVPTDALDAMFITATQMEAMATWLDLVQKSVTMSKRTSTFITVLRVVFRLYTLTLMIMYPLSYLNVLGSSGLGSKIHSTIVKVSTSITFWGGIVAGPLLARILCKDPRDVTNPNWKAASAIFQTGIISAVCAKGFDWGFTMFVKYGIFTNQAQSMSQLHIFFLTMCHTVSVFHWMQYLQFAHRRYLGDVTSSRITQYFGFTTVGMKSSGRDSSLASGKSTTASSAVSSSSSAVSSASVAATSSAEGASTEAPETDGGKGTMA